MSSEIRTRQPRLRRLRLSSGAILLSLPAFLLVVALFIYPFLYGVLLSFRGGYVGEGGWTLANYRDFFGNGYLAGTIGVTFQVSLPVTLVSVGVSIPLAYAMRRGIRFERFITALLILPITLGTVMVSQGMITYFSPTGWFNTTLLKLGIIHQPLVLLHNVLAVQISLFIQGFPFTFLLILGYMSAINPDLERASRMLGAKAWTTFWRVIFPLTLPGIAIAFCLNFVANFSVFPSANLVGEPTHLTHVIAVEAYNQAFSNFRQPFGTAIALIMGVIELLVIALVLWLQSRTAPGATISGGKGA
ncbi:MAG TPA: ABC transporter permease [Ktedonobacteraceae bacterium]|jgi:putative spermidine/putrescine transport system permease protein|nr:ABC transporter permease [Ktedonobacteraceae bacterium]